MRWYTGEEIVEIFERLIAKGFDKNPELNDLTIKQLDDLSRGVVN